MAVRIVVLLEVVDVDKQTSPRLITRTQELIEIGKMSAIKAPGERVAHGALPQLVLNHFAVRDVHEDAVIDRLVRGGVVHRVHRVKHGEHHPIWADDLQLKVPHKTLALDLIQLGQSSRRIHHHLVRAVASQVLD